MSEDRREQRIAERTLRRRVCEAFDGGACSFIGNVEAELQLLLTRLISESRAASTVFENAVGRSAAQYGEECGQASRM